MLAWIEGKATELLVALLLIIAAGVGGYFYGHSAGSNAANLQWSTKENTRLTQLSNDLQTAKEQLKAEEEANRQKEQAAAQTLVDTINTNAKEMKNVVDQKNAAVAALHAGTLQLRDSAAVCSTGGTTAGQTNSGTVASNSGQLAPAGGAQLSPAFSQYLVNEFAACDKTAVTLTSVQALLVKYRSACNSQ